MTTIENAGPFPVVYNNLQPFQVLNMAVVDQGVFPSRDGVGTGTFMGEVVMFAGVNSPGGLMANGQLLSLAQNTALFSLLGTTYGGDGRTNFALPDLRGRAVMGTGGSLSLGGQSGSEQVTVTYPSHSHAITSSGTETDTGFLSTTLNNGQPSLVLNYLIAVEGIFPTPNSGVDDFIPFIGEMALFAGNFTPAGWLAADGSLLQISQNEALFTLIGTAYGGDGQSTFALPDLRGRVPIGSGTGPGLPNYVLGETGGLETININVGHSHGLGTTSTVGTTAPAANFSNLQPFQTLNYIVALEGVFPTSDGPVPDQQFLGEVRLTALPFAPRGWALAQGQLLPINQNQALFSLLGTTYGGDGRTNFALPDLRGRTALHAGAGPGLTPLLAGDLGGTPTLSFAWPNHTHSIMMPPTAPTTANTNQTFVEDTVFAFNTSMFPFFDLNGEDTLQGVRITQLPTAGQLFVDANGNNQIDMGELVVADQELSLAQINQLKFAPAPDGNGAPYASFQFLVSDGGLYSENPGTFTLNVTEVNDAPIANNNTLANIAEDSGPYRIPIATLLGNDNPGAANESSQVLTITAVGGAVGGTVVIDGTDVVFTPTANYNGPASFTYTVRDNGTTNGQPDSRSATATASFNITEVNDAPLAVNDTVANIAEDSAPYRISIASLLANDSPGPNDESSQTLTLVGVENAVGGTVTLDGNEVVFIPTPNYNGPASFTYTVADNGSTNGAPDARTATATVSFNITAVNDAPIAANDVIADIVEDAAPYRISFASLLANDSAGPANENSQTLTITAVNGAVGGTVAIDGTDVVFTPTPNFNGPASFRYTVTDNGTTNGAPDPRSATATVNFNVTAVNDAPIANNNTVADIAEDSGPYRISIASLLDNDRPGPADELEQTLTLTAVNGAVGGTVAIDGTDIVFTPTANFNGPASFTYTVTDNGTTNGTPDPQSSTATVSFNVTAVNDAPIANDNVIANFAEDGGAYRISFATLLGNDSPGPANESSQTLTITAVDNAVGGTVTIDGTDVVFTPNADYNGPASFTYTVTDDGTTNGAPDPLSATATVNFTVTEVNDAPVANNDTVANIAEDSGAYRISIASLLGNDSPGPEDESGQALTITAVNGAVGGAVAIDGTDIVFTPAANFNGPASFTYTVTDNGTTNGAPDPQSSTATVSFNITEVNDAPVANNNVIANIVEDSGPYRIAIADLLGNDSPGPGNESSQTLTLTRVDGAVGGTVAIDGTDVVFTPNADYNGPASFTYTITDDGTTNGAPDPKTATATVTFNVAEENDAPLATNDTVADIAEDSGTYRISFAELLGNDRPGPVNENGQTLTITAVGEAVGGTVAIDGTDVVFTPNADYNGPASFVYTVTDDGTTNGAPDPQSATATVSFNVTAVNDAPLANNNAIANIAEDSGPYRISIASLLANDSPGPANENDQTLTLTGISNVVGGTAVIDGSDIVFTPTPNFNGAASFVYTVTDNGTTNGAPDPKTATATVSFTITEVNDAPVANDDVIADIAEDSGPYRIAITDLLGNDNAGAVDEGTQLLTLVNVNNAVGGVVVVDGDEVVFTPAANFNGPASFTYTVRDNGTTNGTADPQSATATVSFNVTEVNDAPVAADDTIANIAEDSGPYRISFASLLGNDSPGPGNESSQTLTITAVENAVGGTAVIDGTDIVFTPTANYNGLAQFTYTVTDNGTTNGAPDPQSATATVNFNVTAVNDRPIATDDGIANIAEDSGVYRIPVASLLVNDLAGPPNEFGQILTITAVGSAVGGSVAIDGTDIVFTPTTNYNGPASFTYTITDDGTTNGAPDPRTATATVSFVITPVNDAPIATNDGITDILEDSEPYRIAIASLLANDRPGPTNESDQTITLVSVGAAVGGSVVIDGDDIVFTPTPNYGGPASFTYTITDNGTTNGQPDPRTATATVSFVITPVNDAPSFVASNPPPIDEDAGLITLANWATFAPGGGADEAGQQALAYTISNVSDPDLLDVLAISADGTLTYQFGANANGTVTFDVTVQDDGGTENGGIDTSTVQTITLVANPVNDDPTGDLLVGGITKATYTLTADASTVADVDGLGDFSYQWQQSIDGTTWSNIAGATGTTLLLTEAQVGQQVRAEIRYTDGDGTDEVVESSATAAIRPFPIIPSFNGDDQADIAWRHRTAARTSLWYMDGTSLASGELLSRDAGSVWELKAVDDFDRDGSTDLVWQNPNNGQAVIWLMDGNDLKEGILLPFDGTVAFQRDANWQIVATGDFNGDDQADLLWRHRTSGENAVWFMDGTTRTGGVMLDRLANLDWEVGAVDDFTKNGEMEILWRHRVTGQNVVWYMDGTTRTGGQFIESVAAVWRMAGAADFNGDGQMDILYRHRTTTGSAVWFMDGLTRTGGTLLDPVAVDWQPVV